MKPSWFGLCLFFACAAGHAAQPVLSPQGYGAVTFGMPLSAAEKRLGKARDLSTESDACYYVEFAQYPDLRFMIEKGMVERAEAEVSLANSAGVRLGATVEQIKRRYPHARIRPHKYDEAGQYVILPTRDGRAALLFEASGGVTSRIRAGREPAVEYVEGCL